MNLGGHLSHQVSWVVIFSSRPSPASTPEAVVAEQTFLSISANATSDHILLGCPQKQWQKWGGVWGAWLHGSPRAPDAGSQTNIYKSVHHHHPQNPKHITVSVVNSWTLRQRQKLLHCMAPCRHTAAQLHKHSWLTGVPHGIAYFSPLVWTFPFHFKAYSGNVIYIPVLMLTVVCASSCLEVGLQTMVGIKIGRRGGKRGTCMWANRSVWHLHMDRRTKNRYSSH